MVLKNYIWKGESRFYMSLENDECGVYIGEKDIEKTDELIEKAKQKYKAFL